MCSRMHPALREGIRADLRSWAPRSISREAMDAASRLMPESDITVGLGIYNNTVHFLEPERHPRPRNPSVYAIVDDLRSLLAVHRVPNVEFLLNVDDYPKSHGARVPAARTGAAAARAGASASHVPLPLFSYTKRAGSSDRDVLIPSGAFRMAAFDAKLRSRSPAR